MSKQIPAELLYLLEEPNFGSLGTVHPNGTVQVSPMWFEFDGEKIHFTHTNKRQKFRNLQQNPSMSLAVFDPKDPIEYIELRGHLEEVIPTRPGPSTTISTSATAGRGRSPRTRRIVSSW